MSVARYSIVVSLGPGITGDEYVIHVPEPTTRYSTLSMPLVASEPVRVRVLLAKVCDTVGFVLSSLIVCGSSDDVAPNESRAWNVTSVVPSVDTVREA